MTKAQQIYRLLRERVGPEEARYATIKLLQIFNIK
jgi:hypothetical protein